MSVNTSSAHAGLSSRPGAAEESKDAWDITGAAVAVLPAMSGRAALRAAAKRNPELDGADLAPYPLREGSDWRSSFFRARCSSLALASLPELHHWYLHLTFFLSHRKMMPMIPHTWVADRSVHRAFPAPRHVPNLWNLRPLGYLGDFA